MTTTRSKRLASGILVGAGATALTGTMLFTSAAGAHDATTTPEGAVAPATTPTTMADSAQRTLVAADAGTVTVQRTGDVLKVVATAPMNGWTATVRKATGRTVKVHFTSDTTKVAVRAHLTDDGRFRYSVFEKQDPEAMRAKFIAAVAARVEAEKVAAAQAADDKAEAEKAAAAKAAAAKAAEAQADDDHDGRCDHDHDGVDDSGHDDGGELRQASFGDDGDHDGFEGHHHRGGFGHGGHGRR